MSSCASLKEGKKEKEGFAVIVEFAELLPAMCYVGDFWK